MRSAGGTWPRQRIVALALLLASCLAVLYVVQARPVIGVLRQYHYPYRPEARWDAFPALCLLAVPAAVAMALSLRRRVPTWQVWGLVALLTVGGLMLRSGTAALPKHFPGIELSWRFLWKNTEGAYAGEVRAARPVGPFLAAYARRIGAGSQATSFHRVHLDTHPPGLILGFAALEALYDTFPRAAQATRRWALRTMPSVAVLERRGAFAVRHPVAVSMAAAHLAIVVASLAPLVAFLAARQFWPTGQALAAAGLVAVLPGTHLFNPSVDQAYPTLTLVLCGLAARAVATRRARWGVAFGVALYVAASIHVGFALVAAIIALAAVLAWRSQESPQSVAQALHTWWKPVAGALLAFLTIAAVLHVGAGYPTFRVVALCLRNNRVFYEAAGRTWWPWVAVMPLEFAVSLGFPLAIAATAGFAVELAGAVRRRTLRGASALLLASCGALVVLDVTGAALGETARLWLFLTPLLVLGVVEAVWRHAAEPRRVLAYVFAALLLQALVFSVVLDCGRTSTFIVRHLLGVT